MTWPLADSRPVRRAGISTVMLDDNMALYDEMGQLLILLNPGAAAVWDGCDGARTLDVLVESLARAHGESARSVHDDVLATVRKLSELGLVSEAETPALI